VHAEYLVTWPVTDHHDGVMHPIDSRISTTYVCMEYNALDRSSDNMIVLMLVVQVVTVARQTWYGVAAA